MKIDPEALALAVAVHMCERPFVLTGHTGEYARRIYGFSTKTPTGAHPGPAPSAGEGNK